MKSKNQRLRLAALGVGLVALALVIYAVWMAQAKHTAVTPKTTQSPVPQVNLSSPVPVHETTNGDNDKNAVAQATATPASRTPTAALALDLVRASQVGSEVQIRANITGTSSGTCIATFTLGTQSFTATNPISFDVSRGICGAFNVPVSSFAADGTWQMSLKAQSGPAISNSVSQPVTVKKGS